MQKLLNPKQLAELLNVSPKTVYFWSQTGFVPHIKLGKCVRFEEAAIEKWIEARSQEGRGTLKYKVRA